MAKSFSVGHLELRELLVMDAVEFRIIMRDLSATLDTMAEVLGVARRLIAGYRKDKPIPRHIALAARMLRATAQQRGA